MLTTIVYSLPKIFVINTSINHDKGNINIFLDVPTLGGLSFYGRMLFWIIFFVSEIFHQLSQISKQFFSCLMEKATIMSVNWLFIWFFYNFRSNKIGYAKLRIAYHFIFIDLFKLIFSNLKILNKFIIYNFCYINPIITLKSQNSLYQLSLHRVFKILIFLLTLFFLLRSVFINSSFE